MAYITYDEFLGYNREISDLDFRRYEVEAERIIDMHTTGVDNVRKLVVAFPEDERAVKCVKLCCVCLIETIDRITKAENEASGYVEREDGTVVGKAITSISSGSESITYAAGGNTSISAAVVDRAEREKLYSDIVRRWLSGVVDKNGVNLLYMGAYPDV